MQKTPLKCTLSALFLSVAILTCAQNVAINTTGSSPNSSAILDLSNAASMALLAPQVTLTSTTLLTPVPGAGAAGLIVYNNSNSLLNGLNGQGYYYWTGATGSPANTWLYLYNTSNSSAGWGVTGNIGTSPGTNFAGTTDAKDFVIKTNSFEAMRVTAAGSVGIGTTTPQSTTDVNGNMSVGTYAGVNTAPAGGIIVSGQVGIGTNAPNASAKLDVTSSTSGFLPPRMSGVQMNAIASPATGLMVLNTTTNCMEYYNGSMWQNIDCPCTGPPATPGTITGNTAVCASSSGHVYTITPVASALSYTWTLPTGATITAGLGTNSITVTFGATPGIGSISVVAYNSCGISGSSILADTSYTSPAAPAVPSGTLSPLISTSNTYTIAPIVNATSYIWSVSSTNGTVVAGQGTTSATIAFSSTPATMNICVSASNACGNSAPSCLSVTSTNCLPGVVLDTYVSQPSVTSYTISTTNANELVMVSADGWYGPLSQVAGTVQVDGHNATYITSGYGSNSSETSMWAYLATASGIHTITCTESGLSSPYYLNFAATFYGNCSALSVANVTPATNNWVSSNTISLSLTTTMANSYILATSSWNVVGASIAWVGASQIGATLNVGSGISAAQAAVLEAVPGTYTITATENQNVYQGAMSMCVIHP